MTQYIRRMRFALGIICAVLIALSAASAQQITGDIRGTVTDPSGAVIPGATVTITNTDQNAVLRTIKTDKDGSYIGTDLPAGNYRIKVTAEGFQTKTVSAITLNVN